MGTGDAAHLGPIRQFLAREEEEERRAGASRWPAEQVGDVG